MQTVWSLELSFQQLVLGTVVRATALIIDVYSLVTEDTILATNVRGLIIATAVLVTGTGGPVIGETTLATAASNPIIRAIVLASFDGSIIQPLAPAGSMVELLLQ